MEQFLTDDDLLGLLEELDQEDAEIEELEFEMEMEASTADTRRLFRNTVWFKEALSIMRVLLFRHRSIVYS